MGDIIVGINTVWVLLAAFLVFFMQAGFGMVEAGFIRAKNSSNLIMKNFIDFCFASIVYFIVGYAFMFGAGTDLIGLNGFLLLDAPNSSGIPLFAFVLFQAAFAGAAATIVAGAVAERMKFSVYLIYTVILSAFIYPIVGHWIWGGGWLAQIGFADFAGSTVVHALGGSTALIGAYILGPRIGKFNKDGTPNIIAGHNIPMAALGTFILWFGWFGFNAGSTLSVGDGSAIALISLNTCLAAAAGGITSMVTVWGRWGKPDLSMTMNGILGGLVAITAPCAYVSPGVSIIIGALAGIFVVYGVVGVEKLQIDDPVGAVAVHGVNGVWGTLAVGIFGQKCMGLANDSLIFGGGFTQLSIQALGVLATISFCVISMGIVFKIIKSTLGLRVSRLTELKGLDIEEHGIDSYSDFQLFLTK